MDCFRFLFWWIYYMLVYYLVLSDFPTIVFVFGNWKSKHPSNNVFKGIGAGVGTGLDLRISLFYHYVNLKIIWKLYLFTELKKRFHVSEIWLREKKGDVRARFRPFVWKNDPKKLLFRMLGEVLFSINGPNGLIFGQWVDMCNILKITEGIRDISWF